MPPPPPAEDSLLPFFFGDCSFFGNCSLPNLSLRSSFFHIVGNGEVESFGALGHFFGEGHGGRGFDADVVNCWGFGDSFVVLAVGGSDSFVGSAVLVSSVGFSGASGVGEISRKEG